MFNISVSYTVKISWHICKGISYLQWRVHQWKFKQMWGKIALELRESNTALCELLNKSGNRIHKTKVIATQTHLQTLWIQLSVLHFDQKYWTEKHVGNKIKRYRKIFKKLVESYFDRTSLASEVQWNISSIFEWAHPQRRPSSFLCHSELFYLYLFKLVPNRFIRIRASVLTSSLKFMFPRVIVCDFKK